MKKQFNYVLHFLLLFYVHLYFYTGTKMKGGAMHEKVL